MIIEREAKLNAAREQEERKKRAFRKAQKKKKIRRSLAKWLYLQEQV